ncbi:hypothetical protein [Gordonia sp. (in: high G+C Gram-positive bacteria)]|uniref:hypothetical protein n=1 Tax=Gordonia sp. (in: high G+C Gram-positive bacteria) TaxID=84139 RepID=UPI003C71069C
MSELQQLKQTLNSIAQSTKQIAGELGSFERKFQSQSNRVSQAIGGSAQRKDREVLEALSKATRDAKQAEAALQNAARVASQYGASL